MKCNARQLAKALGVQTSTITRNIDKGKISANKDAANNWEIDVAEVMRVYGDRVEADLHGNLTSKVAKQSDANAEDYRFWKMKAEFLEQRLADIEKDREQDRLQVDRMHELYKDTVRLLEAPRSKGWLTRLLGS